MASPWLSIIAIAIAALVPLAAIWWLWWRLPRRQVARLSIQIPDPKAHADAEDNFRTTVGQALGGAAVLLGAGAAYLQFTQQQQASHDLLISNQASTRSTRCRTFHRRRVAATVWRIVITRGLGLV
jgi:ABC-type nickel/cobalt efflux system permease component RcnA